MFIINDLCHAVCKDNAIGSTEAFRHPLGEADSLLDENICIGTGLLDFAVLFHNESSIAFGTILHFLVVVIEVLCRVRRIPAQRLFYEISTKCMCIGALHCIWTCLVWILFTQQNAGRTV